MARGGRLLLGLRKGCRGDCTGHPAQLTIQLYPLPCSLGENSCMRRCLQRLEGRRLSCGLVKTVRATVGRRPGAYHSLTRLPLIGKNAVYFLLICFLSPARPPTHPLIQQTCGAHLLQAENWGPKRTKAATLLLLSSLA